MFLKAPKLISVREKLKLIQIRIANLAIGTAFKTNKKQDLIILKINLRLLNNEPNLNYPDLLNV